MKASDRRGIFANVLPSPDVALEQEQAKPASPKIRQMFEDVRDLQQKGDALDRLLAAGAQIAEFEPQDILPSAVVDRFEGAYDDLAIQDLVDSMRERGQVSPGLVRPVGSTYQIVFGRRRLAAARKLGLKFRAIVRELSDEQAIILQGEENANRNELSFIEKCAFAKALEESGYTRTVICAALSTSKSHLSEMLKIVRTIPKEIITAIGSVPEIGRDRWLAFHKAWDASSGPAEQVLSAIASKPDGNRFALALAAMTTKTRADVAREIRSHGLLLATASGQRLTLSRAAPDGFMDYLTNRMEELHADFMKTRHKKG